MNEATQQLILTEIVKGKNGIVEKTEANTALLQEFVGQKLDCRFDFTRTQTSLDEDGVEVEKQVTEDMYCGVFKESDDGLSYMVERDKLDNYDGTEVYDNKHEFAGQNTLAHLQSKPKITLA